jgi:hypothetical protein
LEEHELVLYRRREFVIEFYLRGTWNNPEGDTTYWIDICAIYKI